MSINANTTYPLADTKRLCFLKNIINAPNIIVGDYTYYDDPEGVENFTKNVLYHFDFIGDKLIIGKFCQIATGTRFIMNGANHAMKGYSTYPFKVFSKEWQEAELSPEYKGDTKIGNDVWIGNGVTLMPGVTVGDGAILESSAVITKDVEPYSIVGGNPARLIRKRFDEKTINGLLRLRWWDWPVEKITKHLKAISLGDSELLINN